MVIYQGAPRAQPAIKDEPHFLLVSSSAWPLPGPLSAMNATVLSWEACTGILGAACNTVPFLGAYKKAQQEREFRFSFLY